MFIDLTLHTCFTALPLPFVLSDDSKYTGGVLSFTARHYPA